VRARKDKDLEQQVAAANLRIAELERELAAQGTRDSVTGLLSLSRFRAQLDMEVSRTRRHGRVLSAAVLDLDGFRTINARHGYSTGDEVLSVTSNALSSCLRTHDLACRTGADEFAVLLPETDADGAEACMKRVLEQLEGAHAGAVHSITASIGVATFARDHSAAELLAEAGYALERSRAAGGGRVMCGGVPTDGDAYDTDQRDAVAALAVALLERDRYTGDHSEAVVTLAGAVARGLGLDDDEVHRVQAAALLHDIGKVAVPDEVLNKPGKLTEEEWKLMRDHTVIGERILRAIPGLGNVARIVRHEHERWDGNGYPDGIAGTEIPIGARIILACDAYHAMVSDRPYRQGMPHDKAMEELTANAGTQFDPDVVSILVGELYGRRQAGMLVV